MSVNPSVSIIVPAYGWPEALALAIESALRQTHVDFELLVTGDACTKGSEDVARNFKDPRLVWTNLDKNSGSAAGPRNTAIAAARAPYIAYLDQDDLWHPDHLHHSLRTARETDTDIIIARALMAGPAGSGLTYASGVLPDGHYTSHLWFPASSLIHKKDVTARIGPWVHPEHMRFPLEVDFMSRAHLGSCTKALTGHLTSFAYPAAWRRNSYRRRQASDQEDALTAMNNNLTAYDAEQNALWEIAAVTPGWITAVTDDFCLVPGERAKAMRRQRGLHSEQTIQPLVQERSFTMDDQEFYSEWWQLEQHPRFGSYRWSGPAVRSSLVLPVQLTGPARLGVFITNVLKTEDLKEASLSIGDERVTHRLEPGDEKGTFWLIVDRVPPAANTEGLTVTIHLPRTHRPCDLHINNDTRCLGLAVNRMTLQPLANT